MERKLASIQRIVSIEPIEGADKIVKATVLGWNCVTQKSNNFKPGDLVVYFEIDSMLPLDNPVFDFLKDPKKPERTHHRLKTIRLKGQIAQGLILPIHLFDKIKTSIPQDDGSIATVDYMLEVAGDEPARYPFKHIVDEGTDLTEVLGITKYEPEVPPQLAGLVEGAWPFFLSKTDETRIQAAPGVLTRRKGELMYATEKIDGTSFTCYKYSRDLATSMNYPWKPEDEELGYKFGVCSRNLPLKKTDGNVYWKMVEKYNLEQKLVKYEKNLALQGEIFGLGIQGNKLKRETIELAIFNVFDLETRQYLGTAELNKVLADLGLTKVPEVYLPFVLDHTVDQLVVMAMVKSKLNPDVWAEGIVVRPVIESTEKDLGRFSFKVINPEFLLKFGE